MRKTHPEAGQAKAEVGTHAPRCHLADLRALEVQISFHSRRPPLGHTVEQGQSQA